jgi:hypothetical protein
MARLCQHPPPDRRCHRSRAVTPVRVSTIPGQGVVGASGAVSETGSRLATGVTGFLSSRPWSTR